MKSFDQLRNFKDLREQMNKLARDKQHLELVKF